MNNDMIVTNLRIPQEELLQLKAMAAEMDMSFNEYVRYLLESLSVRRELSYSDKKITARKKGKQNSIWDLSSLAKEENHPMGELSQEDKIIYG